MSIRQANSLLLSNQHSANLIEYFLNAFHCKYFPLIEPFAFLEITYYVFQHLGVGETHFISRIIELKELFNAKFID